MARQAVPLALVAALAIAVTSGSVVASQAASPAQADLVTGQELRFAGTVSESGRTRVVHARFVQHEQIWFRVAEHPDRIFLYLAGSSEQAVADGFFAKDPERGYVFAQIEGRRVEGRGRARESGLVDVVAVTWR